MKMIIAEDEIDDGNHYGTPSPPPNFSSNPSSPEQK
jgi:hypothetical protein